MPTNRTPGTKRVTAALSLQEHTELQAVAKQADMPPAHLARVFVTFCLKRLAAGDAELQRAVKGSRDAETGHGRALQPYEDGTEHVCLSGQVERTWPMV